MLKNYHNNNNNNNYCYVYFSFTEFQIKQKQLLGSHCVVKTLAIGPTSWRPVNSKKVKRILRQAKRNGYLQQCITNAL